MRHCRIVSRFLAVLVLAVLSTVLADWPAVAGPVVNPPWRAHCPATLGILVDQSASMSGRFGEVRTAVSDVVDAMRDKRSEVTVVGFGTAATVIRSAVDVSNSDARHDLKDQIGNLDALGGNDGGTNWEAAFNAVAPLHLDVVVLVTDGEPNLYGNPAQRGPDVVAMSIAAADRLKSAGTRVVGVGIGLQPDGQQNLEAVTGPTLGQDFYSSDTESLLHQLYQIVSSTCGVPVAALPTPEPPTFPWLATILGALGGLVALGVLAVVLSRRKRGASVSHRGTRVTQQAAVDPTIDHSRLTGRLRENNPNSPVKKDQP